MHELPREQSVSDILEDYIAQLTTDDEREIAGTICAGIKDYFDDALPRLLLYKSERAQVRAGYIPERERERERKSV